MLEELFKSPTILSRHRNAPLLEERTCYLASRAGEGCAHGTLLRIARELFQIVQLLHIPSTSKVTSEQLRATGERWARQQCRRGRAHTLRWPRELFIHIATEWLRFLGRLDERVVEPPSFAGLIDKFAKWMESERGLSLTTIHNYCWHVKKFLYGCEHLNRSVSTIQISDVERFLASRGDRGWSRVSIATNAKALKAFFRYAGQRGWCSPAIALAIQGPRLFSQETLPSGPTWEDVNRMVDSLATGQPQHIRDLAIILLLALYGLRSKEVARLRLEDIDWENNRLSVSRPKQRKTQTYPLIPVVGNAIVRYLQTVRPQNFHR